MAALPFRGNQSRCAPTADPTSRRHFRPATRAEPLEPRLLLSDFTVTTTGDAGPGSLRQAILDANATPARDIIRFAIPGEAGITPTIRPLSALPDLITPILITGTPAGSARPGINLDGSAAGLSVDGIVVRSNGSCGIFGLAIYGFSGNGVAFRAGISSQVALCYIGLTADGVPNGNGGAGVFASTRAVIGGSGVIEQPTPNVISGNAGPGVLAIGLANGIPSTDFFIASNLIGTSPAGDRAVPNGGGGIVIDNALGAGIGGNTISGNLVAGIQIRANARATRVLGNRIGTNVAGTDPVPNHGPGVTTAGQQTTIGIAGSQPRNLISGNLGAGVVVASAAMYTSIMGNDISVNGGLGIDLGADGVTPNDPLDADTGPNGRQNFPVITGVADADGQVSVGVRLHSRPLSSYVIELFRSARPDPSGHGEGGRVLRSITVTTNAAGDAQGVFVVSRASLPASSWITAAATGANGNTSEFSRAVSALRGRPVYRPDERPRATPPMALTRRASYDSQIAGDYTRQRTCCNDGPAKGQAASKRRGGLVAEQCDK